MKFISNPTLNMGVARMNQRRLLKLSNYSLILLSLVLLVSIFVAYLTTSLPMIIQLVAHILLTLSAAAIKLCYLARISAQKALNLTVC